jgi:hypothetical protein
MHEGYFVGRKELIGWIQQHFQPSFQKIEDLGSGVVYCQIIDSIYPECKVMAKVKRDAKIEVDYINNFKQLQKAFSQKKIDRFIEIDKLSKKSFQTNMEFVQARPPSPSSTPATRDCTLAPRRRRGHPATARGPTSAPEACPLHACFSPRSPRRSHLAHHGARLRVRASQFMKCYWDMHAPNGAVVAPEGTAAPLADQAANEPAATTAPPVPKKAAPPKEAPPPKPPPAAPTAAPKEAPKRMPASSARAASEVPSAASSAGAGAQGGAKQLALEVTELKMSVENLEREV